MRGQLIGLMGSTGRLTGSHLHYEVRIAGRLVAVIVNDMSEVNIDADLVRGGDTALARSEGTLVE